MKKYSNFIFDFDGVIIDSIFLQKEALRCTCLKVGIDFSLELFKDFLLQSGKEISEIFRLLEFPKDAKDYYEEYSLKNASKVKLYDGVIEVLQYIQKNNCTISLCTGKRKEKTYDLLNRLSIAQYFDVIICGDMVTKTKPDPEGINIICDKLKISKEETIYIGDATNDILASKRAGIACGAAMWGAMECEELMKYNVEVYLSNISDLYSWVLTIDYR